MDRRVHAAGRIALSERSVSTVCRLQYTRPVCALFWVLPNVRVLHDIPFPPIQPDVQAMLTVLADLAHMHTVDPTATLVILRASQHDVAATARTAIAIDIIHLVVQHIITSKVVVGLVKAALDILPQCIVGQVQQRIINGLVADPIGLSIAGEGNQLGHLVVQLTCGVARDFPVTLDIGVAIVMCLPSVLP